MIQENTLRLSSQGHEERCFLSGQWRVKQVQDDCQRGHTDFWQPTRVTETKELETSSDLFLSTLKDERQCQTLKTITSCLYKQPLVSLDIKQSLGHLLSMPIGLASVLSLWLARKVTGSGMRQVVLQKQSSILPLVAFRIHLLYIWSLFHFACFRNFPSVFWISSANPSLAACAVLSYWAPGMCEVQALGTALGNTVCPGTDWEQAV